MGEYNILKEIKNKKRQSNVIGLSSVIITFILVSIGFGIIIPICKELINLYSLDFLKFAILFLTLGTGYTLLVSPIIKKIINANTNINLEIEELEKKYKEELVRKETIKNIENRFNNLSFEQKIEVLNFIKNNLELEDLFSEIATLSHEDIYKFEKDFEEQIDIEREFNSGYTRKREMN